MSDVGGILYDQDAVYVDVPGIYTRAGDVLRPVGSSANKGTDEAADALAGTGAGLPLDARSP